MWTYQPISPCMLFPTVAYSTLSTQIFISVSILSLFFSFVRTWQHPQEWDGSPGVSEQQLIQISNAVSGTFRLTLDGATTASIPHNALASKVAVALAALPNVAEPVEVRAVIWRCWCCSEIPPTMSSRAASPINSCSNGSVPIDAV